MKINMPLTGRENDYSETCTIVSTTDAKGIITDANQDFIKISGFEQSELIGKNHNLVRHPEMPPAAFQNLWDDLKGESPWLGIVNNRCKNGDNYWVQAFVGPMRENGEVIGYQSVRFKPSVEHVERADKLYKKINAGKLGRFAFKTLGVQNRTFLFLIIGMTLGLMSTLPFTMGMANSYSLLLCLLSLPVLYFMARFLSLPIEKLAAESTTIINNPISRYVFSGRNDELGQLRVARIMQQTQIRTLVGRTEAASVNLEDSAIKSSRAAEETCSALNQQRQDIEQVATSINEMASTVEEVARNTANASDKANHAKAEASKMNVISTKTIATMTNIEKEITTSSKQIMDLYEESNNVSSVLDVIRSIAEQTNLLALNAAIEAARAGEAGRGFAVVADEVRALATKTAESIEEIDTIIERFQRETHNAVESMKTATKVAEDGAEQVGESAEAIANIAQAVILINDLNAQIATAAEQQAAAAQEVNKNVHSISIAIEQTTSTAEDTSKVSENLANLAVNLRSVVHQCDF